MDILTNENLSPLSTTPDVARTPQCASEHANLLADVRRANLGVDFATKRLAETRAELAPLIANYNAAANAAIKQRKPWSDTQEYNRLWPRVNTLGNLEHVHKYDITYAAKRAAKSAANLAAFEAAIVAVPAVVEAAIVAVPAVVEAAIVAVPAVVEAAIVAEPATFAAESDAELEAALEAKRVAELVVKDAIERVAKIEAERAATAKSAKIAASKAKLAAEYAAKLAALEADDQDYD